MPERPIQLADEAVEPRALVAAQGTSKQTQPLGVREHGEHEAAESLVGARALVTGTNFFASWGVRPSSFTSTRGKTAKFQGPVLIVATTTTVTIYDTMSTLRT